MNIGSSPESAYSQDLYTLIAFVLLEQEVRDCLQSVLKIFAIGLP